MYTKIDSAFWTDEKVLRMTPTARYVMLYLLTCPHRNMLGLYRLPKLYAQSDLRLSEKEFTAAWREVEAAGMIRYDEECEVVFIRHYMRYHALDNGNQVKAAVIKVKELPRTRLLSDLADELQTESGKGYETLIETVRQRVTLTHTETVTQTSIKKEVKEKEKGDEEEHAPPKADYESEFETLWELYPKERRQGKQKAKDKYIRVRKSGTTFETVKDGLERYVKHIADTHTEARYIKQAQTWFNGECWQDEYDDTGGSNGRFGEVVGDIHGGNGTAGDRRIFLD